MVTMLFLYIEGMCESLNLRLATGLQTSRSDLRSLDHPPAGTAWAAQTLFITAVVIFCLELDEKCSRILGCTHTQLASGFSPLITSVLVNQKVGQLWTRVAVRQTNTNIKKNIWICFQENNLFSFFRPYFDLPHITLTLHKCKYTPWIHIIHNLISVELLWETFTYLTLRMCEINSAVTLDP